MNWFLSIFSDAIVQILEFDTDLIEVVSMTLKVSISALIISSLLAIPIAAILATANKFRNFPILVINSLMGLPPVLVGLVVYLLLSHKGPLGAFQLLFTPTAMIVAQVLLIFPIVCGLSQVVFRERWLYFENFFKSIQLSKKNAIKTIIFESRYQLLGALVSGLGRGLAEVGAVMIVGGNIMHHTRTITTAITLETSKGEIVNAVSLGIILLIISFVLNALLIKINHKAL